MALIEHSYAGTDAQKREDLVIKTARNFVQSEIKKK
jgi:hypothetical protein